MTHIMRDFSRIKTLRLIFVILFAILILALFPPLFWLLLSILEPIHVSLPVEPSSAGNSMVQAAVEKRIDFSVGIYQTVVILFSGGWALLLSSKDESAFRPISEWPEVVLLVFANIALISSIASHFIYVFDITSMMIAAEKNKNLLPNVDSLRVHYALWCQILNMIAGALITGTIAIVARLLKRSHTAVSLGPKEHVPVVGQELVRK